MRDLFIRWSKRLRSILLALSLASLTFVLCPDNSFGQSYDYIDTPEKAVWFFDANKCGPNAANDNVFSRRGACHTNDGSEVSRDLSGGFHDAGDLVKFGLPQGFSASVLGWSLYEHRQQLMTRTKSRTRRSTMTAWCGT